MRRYKLFGLIISVVLICFFEGCGKSTETAENSIFAEETPVKQLPKIKHPKSSVRPIPKEIQKEMKGKSWRKGCPVGLKDLRYIQTPYWGFDGQSHQGEIIVHKNLAKKVSNILREMYIAKFPIEKMRLVHNYGGSDDESMADNNTSGFNCRKVAGKSKWSRHAYGYAIDINPVQNPYILGEKILPPAAKDFVDRTKVEKGMIKVGDPCHNAFSSRGYRWGGDRKYKDYQHFDKSVPKSLRK